MWIPQHVNILFRSWRENIVYQVACIMYMTSIEQASAVSIPVPWHIYQWIQRKMLLNIQQASWSCNFFFLPFFLSYLLYFVGLQKTELFKNALCNLCSIIFRVVLFGENVLPHIFCTNKKCNIFSLGGILCACHHNHRTDRNNFI